MKTKIIASLELIFLILSISLSSVFPSYAAVYTESTSDTFIAYRQKLESALQDMQREFQVNNSVSEGTISNVRNLVQETYIRLPDNGDYASKNESIKKSVDLYLDLASKNKTSQTHVSNAASNAGRFLSEVKIEQITGSIQATPTSGNAPLTTSFLASAKDPSGVSIPDANYIWWTRERYGRNVIGTGPTLTYSFSKEGSYQVFLDVVSNSRNSKGKIDVLPVTLSQDIEVKPRLGNIVLLINGVNVSNMDQLKVSPSLGKIGLLFDATASRAISNGTIIKTEWDFGNGNTLSYAGSPVIERQPFVNEGNYKVTVRTTSNQGQIFSKDINLVVRDPAAVISTTKDVVFVGEDINMSAKTYLSNTNNVEYNWIVQELESEKKNITTQKGSSFAYKFQKAGQYIITLTTRSPNGNTDSDSRVLVVESHPPTVNLDPPSSISSEKPNTIVFDASRSFDMDTKSTKGLLYAWAIDGESVTLNDPSHNGAWGTYTFDSKGKHTVSLTVSNSYGKVTTVDKEFDVRSILTVGMNITPRAAQLGTPITFQARSPRASFYEWNTGDGAPSINGTSDTFQYTYKKTGVYNATLRVKNADGSEENTITRTVYITDTDSPFALISASNGTNTVIENPEGCENNTGSAFMINRSESTTIDGGKSINVDGNAAGLTYTWKYFGQVKTGPTLSEKFTEIGCFPIELTVRSDKTGASHTSRQYLDIKNLSPKITSVTTAVDETKKDSQKVIVAVSANGARDDDGVITSYVWYYTTESDNEKQNVRITQSPMTTFVLPNVTEKYYFGVIIEDNDGARVDSLDVLSDKSPLIIGNEDANVNMPLISLSVDKTNALTDETLNFSANAKDILGRDITAKSEYYWDFDGDGHVDRKTTTPQISYSYKNSGRYNMKLKMVNNGSSNTKYQVIYVKNELKAGAKGYRIGDTIYFINTSAGSYDKVEWSASGYSSESATSFMLPINTNTSGSSLGTLTVKSGANEISTIDLTDSIVEMIAPSVNGDVQIQTYPTLSSGSIQVTSPSEKVIISAFGNTAKEYIIDADTKIDSDLDGITDNDKDNKDTPSFSDGSAYVLSNLNNTHTRNREIKFTLVGENGIILSSKIIPLTLTYIAGNTVDLSDTLNGSGSDSFSAVDKTNLEKLQAKIRTLNPDDRIVFTQYYNTLVENWGDLHDRTQGLLDLQEAVTSSTTLDAATKSEMSSYIDIILVGDAQATNEITVASRVIEGLIKLDNPNRDYIIERLEKIKSHPGNLGENKILGKEILQKVETDTNLSNADKLLLKSQLQIIVNGGQESIPESEQGAITEESGNGEGFLSGMMTFIKGTVKIFALILGIIGILVLLGYIFYRLTRKNEDTGFQDFLIDSVAHNRKSTPLKTAEAVVKAVEIKPSDTVIVPPVDPLASYNPPKSTTTTRTIDTETSSVEKIGIPPVVPESSNIPVSTNEKTEEKHSIPEWLKPIPNNTPEPGEKNVILKKEEEPEIVVEKIPEAPLIEVSKIPEAPLPETTETNPKSPIVTEVSEDIPLHDPLDSDQGQEEDIIPDWLKPIDNKIDSSGDEATTDTHSDDPASSGEPVNPPSTDLPDWLKASLADEGSKTTSRKKTGNEKKTPKKKKHNSTQKPANRSEASNITTEPSSEGSDDIPDWLK